MPSLFNVRRIIAYLHDIVMTVISFGLAMYLRLGADAFLDNVDTLLFGASLLAGIGAVVYWHMGLYSGIWRYASIRDLNVIARAVSLTILIFLLIAFISTRLESLPRSIPFINWLALMAMLGGPRLAYRIIRDRSLDMKDAPGGKRRTPVLLVGAGDGTDLFIRSLTRFGAAEYKVVGILSEKPQRVGQQIHGVSVLDTLENLPAVFERLARRGEKPARLIITKGDLDGSLIRKLFSQATELKMKVARMPKDIDFRINDPDKVEVRPIDLEDLLGRPPAVLDQTAMSAFISGKRVLITGAGGSIGSELSRQISALIPAEITLLDSSEFGLYLVDREIRAQYPDMTCHSVIGDVRDPVHIERIFTKMSPQLVFHAAALKHVPLVEENCCEGVITNTHGTRIVADACVRHGTLTMVQISTDKAINPTNVMGASKRIAEQYCQALDLKRGAGDGTNFVTVRFGNVLGSTGSVVPLFRKQLENGGPLTVTHPDMTRYFMTVREAVELVLLAAAKAQPGSSQDGKIFVLDMGEPVKIIDLAKQMIHLAGYEPGRDIDIKITGCRPGEKLFEEIFHDAEDIIPTDVEGVFLAAPRASSLDETARALDALFTLCNAGNEPEVRRMLKSLVPESEIPNLHPVKSK